MPSGIKYRYLFQFVAQEINGNVIAVYAMKYAHVLLCFVLLSSY